MGSLSTASFADVARLHQSARERLSDVGCLEDAAQRLADVLYETYLDSVVLVRVFATAGFGTLPPESRRRVEGLVSRHGARPHLRDTTPVLSLFGTRGESPGWNRREDSRDHAHIPLVSAEFVDGVPMISRLLAELGLPVGGVVRGETAIVSRVVGNLSGVFYVEDAATATDARGRPIISSRAFVSEHGVRTVFGFGGAYTAPDSLAAIVVFAREHVERARAEALAPLASVLKTATLRHVYHGRLFAPARASPPANPA